MSSRPTPADAIAASDESISRSSTDRSQCSPKSVHPMPTMATRSRMPCEPMSVPLLGGGLRGGGLVAGGQVDDRLRLPEVVVDAAGRDDPPEGHLHAVPDGHGARIHIGELAAEAAPAVEVDHGGDDRWAGGERQAIDRRGR